MGKLKRHVNPYWLHLNILHLFILANSCGFILDGHDPRKGAFSVFATAVSDLANWSLFILCVALQMRPKFEACILLALSDFYILLID